MKILRATFLLSLSLIFFMPLTAMAEAVTSSGNDMYGSIPSASAPPAGTTPASTTPPVSSANSNTTTTSNYTAPSLPAASMTSGGGNTYTNMSSNGGNQYSGSTGGNYSGSLQTTPSVLLTPPPTDVSMSYLASIFGTVDGVLAGVGSQILGKMFGTFNAVVLALGGIILMYVIIVSTISTAHEGEVMGKKWSSIWIPIRVAAGVGLLVPKASGYSVIQIVMMWVVTQGIGAADSVWSTTLGYLSSGGVIVNTFQGTQTALNNGVIATSKDTLRAMTCVAGLQQALQNSPPPNSPPPPLFMSTFVPGTSTDGKSGVIQFPTVNPKDPNSTNYLGYAGVCGMMTWPLSGNASQDTTTSTAAMQIVSDLMSIASQLAFGASTTPVINPTVLNMAPIFFAAMDYNNLMLPVWNSQAQGSSGGYGVSGNGTGGMSTAIMGGSGADRMKRDGWIMAGAYYLTISQGTAALIQANSPPAVANAGITNALSNPTLSQSPQFAKGSANAQTMTQIGNLTEQYITRAATQQSVYMPPATLGQVAFPPITGLTVNLLNLAVLTKFFPWLNINSWLAPIDDALTQALIYPLNWVLTQIVAATGNPIQTLAGFGAALLAGGFNVWAAVSYIVGSLSIAGVTFFTPGAVPWVQLVLSWATPVLLILLGATFVGGFMAAIYIPMVPYILFVFGAIGWFVGVIETMVAAPLVALGLMSPEGDEAFGKASHSIMLLTNVFLRPTLMIFGYIAGIIMSYIGIWLLSRGFVYVAASTIFGNFAAAGAGALLTGIGVEAAYLIFSIIGAILIYVTLATIIVQKSFAMINTLPDQVLTWVGGTTHGPGAGMAAEMGQQAEQKVHGGAEKAGGMAQVNQGKPGDEGDATVQIAKK